MNYNGIICLLAIAIAAGSTCLVMCEPDQDTLESGNQNNNALQKQQQQDKRQYLLAQPRIGRSPNGQASGGNYLTSGSGQVPNSLFSPLSSIVFYAGNTRRVVSPRSGLLPQARIGRRASASPMGLMPQPRVGRRSGSTIDHLPHRIAYYGGQSPLFSFVDRSAPNNGNNEPSSNDSGMGGQQEIPLESFSDSNTMLEDVIGGNINW